ncbi:HNH endonuclease signature motif containing protein [Ornithinimicrobium sediminis]|uniref:HNH endonuclease signature motif containing protein n=1 Tax=Ornithinimicrobium sediminis TaxID=2904603 RepID=UPI001E6043D6|nr:HNH endonuclease signature motif containing protein [Ornithinimicrobium sediminis]MCE0485260.1 HNH endonuclease [Ornithinimicrobium sediminis]
MRGTDSSRQGGGRGAGHPPPGSLDQRDEHDGYDEHDLPELAVEEMSHDDDIYRLTDADLEWLSAQSRSGHAAAKLRAGLDGLGLPPGVADAFDTMLRCAAAAVTVHGSSSDGDDVDRALLTDGALAARVVQGFADAVVVGAARVLVQQAAEELLGEAGTVDPDELSRTARQRWRARAKSAVAQELAVLTGYSVQACHDRVGFAVAPPLAVGTVDTALRHGATDWRAVSDFWSRCRRLEPDAAAQVAQEVFGPLLSEPEAASASSSPSDPGPSESGPSESRRWESWGEFRRRLDREVCRVEGADAAAARARRRAAVEARAMSGEVCDDGVGRIVLTGPTTSVVGALDRLQTIARRARKAGDERSVKQIQADTALALLVHGVLPLPGVGRGSRAAPRPDAAAHAGEAAFDGTALTADGTARTSDGTARTSDGTALDSDGAAQDGEDEWLVPFPEAVSRIITGLPTTTVDVVMPLSVVVPPGGPKTSTGPERRGQPVGELPGHGFLTPECLREILARPGTVLHRLLTDPVDGRVVERSIASYRPDVDMVRQVRAVDRFCRAPGCLVPASRCELDHEEPFGAGGVTSETNLNAKHGAHHQVKTAGWWTSEMDSTRTVTWTTLFGRVYRTRSHDHRQYDHEQSRQGESGHPQSDHGQSDQVQSDRTLASGAGASRHLTDAEVAAVEDDDLRGRLVFAALCSREGHDRWLEALDDYDTGAWTMGVDSPLGLFHRHGAMRRHGPPPAQVTPEEMLASLGYTRPHKKAPSSGPGETPGCEGAGASEGASSGVADRGRWAPRGDEPPPF